MKALVLSGGSIKGAFQAGAIEYVLAKGWKPDLVYGISVGALNGSYIVDRAGRHALDGGRVDWNKIGLDLTSFWTTRVTSPDDLIETKSKFAIALGALLSNFEGIVGIDPLENLVRTEIVASNLRAASTRLFVGAVNLADGSLVYATPAYSSIVDYIIASSAMPIIMPVWDVGGRPFYDGGLRDIAPLGRAINGGATEIVCILCQAGRGISENFNRKNLFQLIGRVVDVITSEILINDLNQVQRINTLCDLHHGDTSSSLLRSYRIVKPILIRPSDSLDYEIDSFSSKDINEMLELGRYEAAEVWKAMT